MKEKVREIKKEKDRERESVLFQEKYSNVNIYFVKVVTNKLYIDALV